MVGGGGEGEDPHTHTHTHTEREAQAHRTGAGVQSVRMCVSSPPSVGALRDAAGRELGIPTMDLLARRTLRDVREPRKSGEHHGFIISSATEKRSERPAAWNGARRDDAKHISRGPYFFHVALKRSMAFLAGPGERSDMWAWAPAARPRRVVRVRMVSRASPWCATSSGSWLARRCASYRRKEVP